MIPYSNVKPEQLLDTISVRKVACSALEVDVSSSFILNRFQLVTKSKGRHTNPGIEAIWNDESMRRQKLVEKHAAAGEEEKEQAVGKVNLPECSFLNANYTFQVPELKLPETQERNLVEIAESDVFYRTALESKLMTLEQSTMSEQTLADQTSLANATMQTTIVPPTSKEQRRTWNLQKLLANTVYPEECSQDQQQHLVNASFIQNHVTCSSGSSVSLPVARDDSECLDETLVDEELILSLSQPHGAMPHDATCG